MSDPATGYDSGACCGPGRRPRRPPQKGIPQTRPERDRIRGAVRDRVRSRRLVPPLSFNELFDLTEDVAAAAECPADVRKWVAVLANNEAWQERLAGIPYERRLLLLPQCLRDPEQCPGVVDELGLVCQGCGRCLIDTFRREALRLGYAVLVSEGTAVVMTLIRTGQIEGVVGVSCMSSLEKVFPLMEAAAVPAVAVPLLYDGCAETSVDADWVLRAIRLSSDAATARMDLDALRTEVEAWFRADVLAALMGPADDPTSRIARDWLLVGGKRWRPFLVAGVYRALADDAEAPLPPTVARIAVAVECFHKASLVHDDIEDQDALRYGEQTLHERHGVPMALNVGDFLIGEGYRLIAEADLADARRGEILAAAVTGHRALCVGQGAELAWTADPQPLAPEAVLDIFHKKTAPAFAVALRMGAVCAGADGAVADVLDRYSEALGVAYQVRDDLDDFVRAGAESDAWALRPSIVLALAYERAEGEARDLLDALWRGKADPASVAARLGAVLEDLQVERAARTLLDRTTREAIRSLQPLASPDLKGLLRRVLTKIFGPIDERASIRDLEARNDPGRAVGAEPAA